MDKLIEITDKAIAVLRPRPLPFISYPYEWSFGQLKAAALLTLAIQKAALEKGMSLKDASAYNIQFDGVKPVFIDTLSFETYDEGAADCVGRLGDCVGGVLSVSPGGNHRRPHFPGLRCLRPDGSGAPGGRRGQFDAPD